LARTCENRSDGTSKARSANAAQSTARTRIGSIVIERTAPSLVADRSRRLGTQGDVPQEPFFRPSSLSISSSASRPLHQPAHDRITMPGLQLPGLLLHRQNIEVVVAGPPAAPLRKNMGKRQSSQRLQGPVRSLHQQQMLQGSPSTKVPPLRMPMNL
jgi:hypothetical protein